MENQALRSLSLSYPKTDWRAGPRQSILGHDTDLNCTLLPSDYILLDLLPMECRLCSWGTLYYLLWIKGGQIRRKYTWIVSVIPKDRWGPSNQSFLWYDNDKDLKAFFPLTRLISTCCVVLCCVHGLHST